MRKILVLSATLLFSTIAFAQSNKLDKKKEAAAALMDKGKTKEADELMTKLLAENPGYGSGWDYLAKIRLKEYKEAKSTDNLFSNLTITTTDKDGKQTKKEDDTLGQKLLDMLTNISPSKLALSKYKYTLRKGTQLSSEAYNCSALLRSIYIDQEIDTAVSKKALKHFNEAEEEFGNKNYNQAAKLYKRAIDEQPGFYKASLYLGDCFYFTGDYVSAAESFKEATEKFPNLLEPRKYLIDSYGKQHLYGKAFDECVQAMTVYPDFSVCFKMDDAAYMEGKKVDIQWTPRGVFPNLAADDSTAGDLNTYKPDKEAAPKPWNLYQDALPIIKSYCDSKGIITKPNSLTQSRYLEVFSWEHMLKNSSDPSLEQARKMQKDGYLDCYVLVTCFHFDLYDQYKDFASKNKDRIAEYYKKYTVAAKNGQ